MTRRAPASLALACALLLGPVAALSGCGPDSDGSSGPSVPAQPVTSTAGAERSVVPQGVLISDKVWTSQGTVATGHAGARAFLPVAGAFALVSPDGDLELLHEPATLGETPEITPLGRLPEGTTSLVSDPAGTVLAAVVVRRAHAVVRMVDVVTHEAAPDLHLRRAPLAVAVAPDALWTAEGEDRVVRRPWDGSAPSSVEIAGAARLAQVVGETLVLRGTDRTELVDLAEDTSRSLPDEVAVSPDGRWAASEDGAWLWDLGTGTRRALEVTGTARAARWLGATSLSLELDTVPLISPPDGHVFHLDTCVAPSGRCRTAVTMVTGANLAAPGYRVDAGPLGVIG